MFISRISALENKLSETFFSDSSEVSIPLKAESISLLFQGIGATPPNASLTLLTMFV